MLELIECVAVYHSHHSLQVSEGLWGIIIIDNTPEAYNYDGEIIIAPTPWYHIPGKEQLEWYMDMEKCKGQLPVPDSNLLNGVGYYPCEYAQRKNMTCEPTYDFSIDEHKLVFIETDGVDTVMSNPIDTARASTGSRLSFLVTMNGDKDQYWMRFLGIFDSIKPSSIPNINPFPEAFFEPLSPMLAILKYMNSTKPTSVTKKLIMSPRAVQGRPEMHDRASLFNMQKNGQRALNFDLLKKETVNSSEKFGDEDPMKPTFANAPFPTTVGSLDSVTVKYDDCLPIGRETAPNYVNQTIVINVADVDDPNSPHHRGGFNNITFDTSTLDKPALFSALLGEKLPKSLNPIVIEGFGSDYVVEVIFNDFGNTGHPIHLHGYSFWVMGLGGREEGPFMEEVHRRNSSPVSRLETISVLTGSWLVIRFRADNPGVWLLHCHIVHHLEAAMGLVFEVGSVEMKNILKIPQKSVELCKLNGIDIVGTSPSNASTIIIRNSVLVAVVLLLFMRSMLNKH